MTWWVVVNPAAGRRNDTLGRARQAFARRGLDAELRTTNHAGHLPEVIAEGIDAGYRQFAAVGGDGTINLVVNALLERPWSEPPVMGILPAGTGSDFARTFGIPQDFEKAIDRLVGDQTYRCDVGMAEGEWGSRYFLNEVQTGVGAAAAVAARRFTRMGARRYTAAFWTVLPIFRTTRVRVKIDERSYEGPCLDVVIANGQFFGGGLNIAPRATVVDGRADAYIFATSAKAKALTIFPRVAKGTHERHPDVKRITGKEFQVETDRPWPVEVDGEPLGSTPFRGRVINGAIDLKI